MLRTRLGFGLLAAIAVLLLTSAQAVLAQPDGTPNLRSGTVYQGPTVGWGEVRVWNDDAQTFSAGITGRVKDRLDATIGLTDIETDDPVGGIVRSTDLQVLSLDFRWQASQGGWMIAFNPAIDLATRDIVAVNTVTHEFADWGDAFPSLGLIFERQCGSCTVIVNPRVAFWEGTMMASNGTLLDGFGTVVGVGFGARKQFGSRLQLSADVTPILSGDNSVDGDTNTVDKSLVWGAGGSYLLIPSHNTWVSVFGTNAFARTGATSLLAAPDDSVSLGVGVSTDL